MKTFIANENNITLIVCIRLISCKTFYKDELQSQGVNRNIFGRISSSELIILFSAVKSSIVSVLRASRKVQTT